MQHLFCPQEMVPHLQPQGETIFLTLKNTCLVTPPDFCLADSEIFNSLGDTGVAKLFNLTYHLLQILKQAHLVFPQKS